MVSTHCITRETLITFMKLVLGQWVGGWKEAAHGGLSFPSVVCHGCEHGEDATWPCVILCRSRVALLYPADLEFALFCPFKNWEQEFILEKRRKMHLIPRQVGRCVEAVFVPVCPQVSWTGKTSVSKALRENQLGTAVITKGPCLSLSSAPPLSRPSPRELVSRGEWMVQTLRQFRFNALTPTRAQPVRDGGGSLGPSPPCLLASYSRGDAHGWLQRLYSPPPPLFFYFWWKHSNPIGAGHMVTESPGSQALFWKSQLVVVFG